MAETHEHEHEYGAEHSEKKDDSEHVGSTKKGIGAELKKRPWLWLVVTVGAGILGWVIYQRLSGSSASTAAATPIDSTPADSGSSGGGGGGTGNPDQEEQLLEQLAAEQQALGQEIAGIQPETITLYTGPPPTSGGTGAPPASTPTPIVQNPLLLPQSPNGGGAISTSAPTKITTPSISSTKAPNTETITQPKTGATAIATLAGSGSGENTLKVTSLGQQESATKTQAKTESSVPKSSTAAVNKSRITENG